MNNETFEPTIIGFTCNWCSYRAADLAGTARMKYAPNVRLIRMMCAYCKRQYHPSDLELTEARLSPDDYRHRAFYMNVGCDACNHTGYRGRTAIHELLDLSDNIREMIVERRPGSEVRRAAEAEGLTSLRESALQKVFNGVSTLHEINRVTFVEELSAGN